MKKVIYNCYNNQNIKTIIIEFVPICNNDHRNRIKQKLNDKSNIDEFGLRSAKFNFYMLHFNYQQLNQFLFLLVNI
jgi:hypothetical protein